MNAEERTGLSDRELLVRIDTRLEGVIEDKRDHEARIRKLEEARSLIEERLGRAVTPKQLWLGAVSAVAMATATIPFFNSVVNR